MCKQAVLSCCGRTRNGNLGVSCYAGDKKSVTTLRTLCNLKSKQTVRVTVLKQARDHLFSQLLLSSFPSQPVFVGRTTWKVPLAGRSDWSEPQELQPGVDVPECTGFAAQAPQSSSEWPPRVSSPLLSLRGQLTDHTFRGSWKAAHLRLSSFLINTKTAKRNFLHQTNPLFPRSILFLLPVTRARASSFPAFLPLTFLRPRSFPRRHPSISAADHPADKQTRWLPNQTSSTPRRRST